MFDSITQQASVPVTEMFNMLSPCEKEMLGLLGMGLSNAEIAKCIYLSEDTVRNYVSSIFEKLGAGERTQAAVLAIRYGLTKLSDS